jgi:hypothetical protein
MDPGKHGGQQVMGGPFVYQIRVRGLLGPQGSAWYDGLDEVETAGGDTTLTALLADQSALHGVLARVRDLGLELVSVTLVAEQGTTSAAEV